MFNSIRYKQSHMSTITQVRRNTTPIRTIKNLSNSTQIKEDNIISVFITLYSENLIDINERGIIRKPSTAKPNMLETFKPTIHSLVPELKDLTDQKLYAMLEEDDDE